MEMKQQKMRISDWNNRSIRFGKSFVFLTLFGIIIANMIASCAMDALEVTGDWQIEGLDEFEVNKIILTPSGDQLVLATDNGVFIYETGSFTPAGLEGKEVIEIVFIGDSEIMAGIRRTDFTEGEITLFKTSDGETNWQAFMGNYGGKEGRTTVNALTVHPDDPQHLFARGLLNVSQSVDGGHTWESIYLDWDFGALSASLLKIDPDNPEIIWAGGAALIPQPYVVRSKDGGSNWKNLLKELQIFEGVMFQSTAYDMAIRPGRSSQLLLGLGTGVFRSTDLGESWESVFSEASVRAMANSPGIADRVYAGGRNSEGTLFLLVTFDFGETWQTVEMPDSPAGIRVNDLAVVEQDGREVIWFATNQGVFSYRVD